MRRCFRYEFVIKTLIIFGVYILNILYFAFAYSRLPFLSPFFLLSIPAMVIYGIKITLQRYHDLGLSGWYVFFLSFVPIVSTVVSLFLFFKKGDDGINEYDEPINYKKLFTDRHCINILDNMIIVDDEEYQYERYLKQYKIKIPNYKKDNFFADYLLKNFSSKEEGIHRTGIIYEVVEISEGDFYILIKRMDFIVIINSFYLRIKGFEVFIRKEDFKFTIILDKNKNAVTKELIDTFDFPGSFYENEELIFYRKIYKRALMQWIKNIV